jgi:hypothetical protein
MAFTTQSPTAHTTTVDKAVLQVADHPSVDSGALIESNIVMGPGRPGSVDKGTPEPRGARLLVTTGIPVTNFAFTWVLAY